MSTGVALSEDSLRIVRGNNQAALRGTTLPQRLTVRVMDPQGGPPNPEPMLRELAKMGYTQVETAGHYGLTSKQYRRLLDRYGLWAHSGHDGFDIDPANTNWQEDYKKALQYAAELGQKFTGFAWFPPPYNDEARFHFLAERFNEAGALAKRFGLQFFYHNHDFEFTNLRADGRPVYTVLLEETDPSLVKFQMDLMWIHFGGGPWRELLTTMPDRFISFHVKDQSPEAAPGCGCDVFADPGQGVVPLEEMIATAGRPGSRRYTVERDSQVHPLTTAQIGYDFLRSL